MTIKKLAIVIPAYKESENISGLIQEILEFIPTANILIVDDSPDTQTKKVVTELNLKNVSIIHRAQKLGRGSAVLHGMNYQLRLNFDYYLEMDADFSHPPKEILSMLNLIEKEKADLVIASRYVSNSSIIDWPIARKIFSRLANKVCRVLLEFTISDYTNGYRIYSKRAVEFTLTHCGKIGDGFILLSEVIVQLSKANYKIIEKETVFRNRLRGESSLSLTEVFGALIGLYKIKKFKKTI
jgi:dolichol-phosphate mannosyltransferase